MSRFLCIKIPPSGGAETSRYQGADIDVVEKKPKGLRTLGLNKSVYIYMAAAQNVRSGSSPGPTNDPDL